MGPVKFGKYTLLEKITTGGMAEVHRGVAMGPGGFARIVAIKKILPCYSDSPEFLRMFQDEASIAARLNHANIAQVYDFDIVDGVPYLAMEFVEGKDVRSILMTCAERGLSIPWPLAVYVALEVAKGLYYVHTRRESSRPLNIVHRDVSPQNIMVSRSGEVKLVDFGIARAVKRQAVTFAGTVKGKYAYMSPEQVSGQPVDHRSDIFSLGTVLWEMLTLRRLFAGENEGETIARLLKTRVPAPHQVNPEVPERLSPFVLTALARNRSERFPTMLAFHESLSRVLFESGAYPDIDGISRFVHDLFPEEMERLAQGEHLAFETAHPQVELEAPPAGAASEMDLVEPPSAEIDLADTIREGHGDTQTRPLSRAIGIRSRRRWALGVVAGGMLFAALATVGFLFGQQFLGRFGAAPGVAPETEPGTSAPTASRTDGSALPGTAVGASSAPTTNPTDP
ncbi:MAG: serine/threonine protein kinase, partial [Deltaproteobacteria bacterium]|nr:serine/threonine protein kinase [Deltaproteobacteria bacterium]